MLQNYDDQPAMTPKPYVQNSFNDIGTQKTLNNHGSMGLTNIKFR